MKPLNEVKDALLDAKKSAKQSGLTEVDKAIYKGWTEALTFVLKDKVFDEPPIIIRQSIRTITNDIYKQHAFKRISGSFTNSTLTNVFDKDGEKVYLYTVSYGVQVGGNGDWCTDMSIYLNKFGAEIPEGVN